MDGFTSSSQSHFWTELFDRLTRPCVGSSNNSEGTIGGLPIGSKPILWPKHDYPVPSSLQSAENIEAITEVGPKPHPWTGADTSSLLPGVMVLLAALVQKQTAANLQNESLRQELGAAADRTLDDDLTNWCGNGIHPHWPGFLIGLQLEIIAETQVSGSMKAEIHQVAQQAMVRSLALASVQGEE